MKSRNTVILSVLATIAFLYIGLPIISGGAISVLDLFYYAGIQDKKSKLIAEYGGSGIVDKYGTLCTTTTYRSWDNACDFTLFDERVPSKTPYKTTLGWLEEVKELNEEFILDSTETMFGSPKCNWIALQLSNFHKVADPLPEGDANKEIYLEGISIFEKSRQKYC